MKTTHRITVSTLVLGSAIDALDKLRALLAENNLEPMSIEIYPWDADITTTALEGPGPAPQPTTEEPPAPTAPSDEAPPAPPASGKVRIMKKAEAKLTEAGTTVGAAVSDGLVGSGKDGMITQADVDGWLKGRSPVGKKDAGKKPPATKAPEFSAVREALSAYMQANGKEAAKEKLARFGVERVSALAEGQYADFIASLKGESDGQ